MEIATLEDMKAAASAIHKLGPKAVLVKGGGALGEIRGTDVWFDGDRLQVLATPPINTPNTHGTGCTLSAAIAAHLAQEFPHLKPPNVPSDSLPELLPTLWRSATGKAPSGIFMPDSSEVFQNSFIFFSSLVLSHSSLVANQ